MQGVDVALTMLRVLSRVLFDGTLFDSSLNLAVP